MPEKLDILNIIEIQQIRSILLKNTSLLNIFNMLLKIANKQLNNELLEDIIDDDESEHSLDLSSDISDNNML
tara:strand:- start:126 stop:341 length:216 start_codon:yes stop_codon:yes gene_type:complete